MNNGQLEMLVCELQWEVDQLRAYAERLRQFLERSGIDPDKPTGEEDESKTDI